jgi:hypothetical protein
VVQFFFLAVRLWRPSRSDKTEGDTTATGTGQSGFTIFLHQLPSFSGNAKATKKKKKNNNIIHTIHVVSNFFSISASQVNNVVTSISTTPSTNIKDNYHLNDLRLNDEKL